MATIKDVAKHAGVSIATVSNYLNKTKPVSRQASAKIAKAIDELQYTQNLAAKSLKTDAYRSIGVILPNLIDSYYLQIFQGIETAVNSAGMQLNLAFSYDIPEVEAAVARQMLQKQVCGLILVTCQLDKWKFYYENFIKNNRPLVLIDRKINSLDTNMICFDSSSAIRAVTEELLSLGYRKLTLMAGPDHLSCEKGCVQSFLCSFSNSSDGTATVVHMGLDKESAFRNTSKLLRKAPPDGIIATSELAATGIVEALRVLGRSTEDIPVITLGEEHWNTHTHTFASYSVPRPAIRIGSSAAQLMIRKLRSPQTQESEQITLNCNIADIREHLQQNLHPAKENTVRHTGKKLRILMLDVPETHAICRLLKNFENQTGIHTEVELRPHSALYDAITESHRSGNGFDVYMYDLPWLPLLAAGGTLKEISTELKNLDSNAFLPGSLEDFGKFSGGFYGIPLMYAPQMLYYRKDLFQNPILRERYEKEYGTALRPPKTFTEYNTVARFFTEQTDAIAYGISVPAAYAECLAPELYMRLRAYGSEVIDKTGKVVLQNQNALKAYVNLLRSVRYAKPNYRQANDVNVVEDFLAGETAMLISYPGFLAEVSDLRKNNLLGSIGCSSIPGKSPLLGGWSLGISSHSKTAAEAFAFLQWACTEQMSNYFSMLGTYSAVTSTYTNDELVQLYPWRPLYQEVYPNAKPMLPSISKGERVISPNDVDDIVCKWLYDMLDGNENIEEILAGTQEELQALLDRRS